jgi:hypothetical protein
VWIGGPVWHFTLETFNLKQECFSAKFDVEWYPFWNQVPSKCVTYLCLLFVIGCYSICTSWFFTEETSSFSLEEYYLIIRLVSELLAPLSTSGPCLSTRWLFLALNLATQVIWHLYGPCKRDCRSLTKCHLCDRIKNLILCLVVFDWYWRLQNSPVSYIMKICWVILSYPHANGRTDGEFFLIGTLYNVKGSWNMKALWSNCNEMHRKLCGCISCEPSEVINLFVCGCFQNSLIFPSHHI